MVYYPPTYQITLTTLLDNGSSYKLEPVGDASRLLQAFDRALEWIEQAEEGEQRMATIAGPDLESMPVTPASRYRIERITPQVRPTIPDSEGMIAVLWVDTVGDPDEAQYRMYKLFQAVTHPGGRREISYRLELVPNANQDKAFDWLQQNFWRPWGVWLDRPGLVFARDLEPVEKAVLEIPELAGRLETGKLERAAVTFGKGQIVPYLYIRSTRNKGDILRLRSEFPAAPADLLWLPKEVLVHRYGLPQQAGIPIRFASVVNVR